MGNAAGTKKRSDFRVVLKSPIQSQTKRVQFVGVKTKTTTYTCTPKMVDVGKIHLADPPDEKFESGGTYSSTLSAQNNAHNPRRLGSDLTVHGPNTS